MAEIINGNTKYGTAGGILTIFIANIQSADLFKTAVLAAVGAFVSFTVSFSLKYCLRQLKK